MATAIGPNARENSFRSRLDRVARRSLMQPFERYAKWMAYFDEPERDALYTNEFRALLQERTATRLIREPYLASDAGTEIDRLLDVDVQTYLPGDLLVKMDIASMAHSLEVRSPLLDHELMELAASLPGAWKVAGRETKKVFKDALRPWLPGRILDRRKWGFGVPLGAWFRGELRDLPGEVLLDGRTLDRGWFRAGAIRRIIDDHQAARRDNTNKIWALIQLELWLRMYIDAVPTAPETASTIGVPA